MCAFDLEHIPALRQQTLVEKDGHQPGEEQDGEERDDHDGGAEGEVLGHFPLLVHPAAGELDGRWEADQRLATQDPHDDSHHEAHDGSIAIRHFEEEDADELWEHDGVGHVHTHQPEDEDAAVQEGEGSASQTHHHH